MRGHELLPTGAGATPVDELVSRGRRRAESRDPAERARGISELLDARSRAGTGEREHDQAVRALAAAFRAASLPRLAHACAVHLGDEEQVAVLSTEVPARDRARAALLGVGARGPRRFVTAADLWREDGKLVGAARALERAEEWDRARALWSRLAALLGAGPRRYETALAWLNVVRTSQRLGDAREQRRAADLVVEHAEEAADAFLRADERERAFDALEVLVSLGRRTKRFEQALLGYVGRARILRQDRLIGFSTATYEEAIAHARHAGENSAAAELARELAELAASDDDGALWRRARREEAESARMAAVESGRPDALVEPMLLAAARAYADIGLFSRVAAVYGELGERARTPERRAYYAGAVARYASVPDRAAPRPLGGEARPPSVDLFHVDLAEWEADGSACEAAGDLLLDPECATLTRRRALTVQLAGLLCEPDAPTTPAAGVALVGQLATLEVYAMLSPLEHLARSPHLDVRASVAGALGRFRFKRALSIARSLAAEPELAQPLSSSIEQLSFAHGIDPLLRLARAPDERIARAALVALAELSHSDAGEVLLDYFVSGGDAERRLAGAVVEEHPSASLRSAAKRALEAADPTRRAIAARLAGP